MRKNSQPKTSYFLLLAGLSLCFACNSGPKLKIQNQKDSYAPGETVLVEFKAGKEFATDAWVGLIPANIAHGAEVLNDQHDLTFQYLRNQPEGVLLFSVPNIAGSFDFRMHDRNSGGKEVASVSINISQEGNSPVSLKIENPKDEYAKDERIDLSFIASGDYPEKAWIGVLPSDIPHGNETFNDRHEISYQYLKKKTSGTLSFKAPNRAGSFDFRMHDTDENGVEVASLSFKVGSEVFKYDVTQVVIETEKPIFTAQETIAIEYKGMPGNEKDWITVVKVDAPENTYGQWFYTAGKKEDLYRFKPLSPGDYEARVYFDWPTGGYQVQKRHRFQVK